MTALLATDDAPESWALLATKLRERDHDPTFADAPVLDVYARISFNPTTGDLEKTDRQIMAALGVIEGREARLGKIHRDDNRSAWKRNAKRPGFRDLMGRLEAGTVAGVVCWHLDRLLRQPRDLERLIDIAERGASVLTVSADFDLSSRDGRLTARVVVAAACKSSDDTAERQRTKMQANRDKGKLTGGPRTFAWPGNDPKTGQPVPDEQIEAERGAIADGTRAVLAGMERTAIANEWNTRGLRTVNGRLHTLDTVRQILSHARYSGLLTHNGRVVGRLVEVDPIVSRDEWEQVCAVFDASKVGRPINAGANLLSGLFRCALCDKPMTSQPVSRDAKGQLRTYDDGTPRRKYVCRKPQGCGRLTIDQRRSDEHVRERTIERLASPQHAQQIAARSQAVAELDGQLGELGEQIRDLDDRYGAGKLDFDRWESITARFAERRAAMVAERAALAAEGLDVTASAASRADVERRWEAATNAERRAMVRQAFPHGLAVASARGRGPGFDPTRITPITRRTTA